MESRNQFTFYRSFWDAVLDLPEEDKLVVLQAIIQYALDGEVPEQLSSYRSSCFKLCKPTLDTARKKAKAMKAERAKKSGQDQEIEIENEIETECECNSSEGSAAAVCVGVTHREILRFFICHSERSEESVPFGEAGPSTRLRLAQDDRGMGKADSSFCHSEPTQ